MPRWVSILQDAGMRSPVIPNWLIKELKGYIQRLGNILTFSQMTNSLAVDRRAVVINVGHQKLAEVPYNRPTNTVMGNPFNNRFGLNVA
jgi:hypothetical protein